MNNLSVASNNSSIVFNEDLDALQVEIERHLEEKEKKTLKMNGIKKKTIHIVRISTDNKKFTRDPQYFKLQKKELEGITIKSTNDDGKGTLYIYLESEEDAMRVVKRLVLW